MIPRIFPGKPLRTIFRPLSTTPKQFFTEEVKRSGSLTLNGKGDVINERDIKELERDMSRNKDAVKSIKVENNHFNPAATVAFADLVEKDKGLQGIIFNGNNFGEGITAVTQALKKSKSLRMVVWGRNWVDYSFQKATPDFIDLATSNSLKTVSLNIDFSGEEIDEIMTRLKNNKSPQNLILRLPLTDNAAQDIIAMIPQNTSLRQLGLDLFEGAETIVDSAFHEKIAEALKENALLESVTIYSKTSKKNIINDNPSQLKDVIKDYSGILQARLIKAIFEGNWKLNHSFSDDELKEIANCAEKKTAEILLKNLTNAEILAFLKHWHSPFHQTVRNKVKDYEGAWHPLFGSDRKEIKIPSSVIDQDGWKLVTRTSPAELKKEGENLKHCVAGYSPACSRGESHIVSVVNNEGKSVSTIEFKTTNNSITLSQHYGMSNGAPPREGAQALEWLQKEIGNKSIEVDYEGIKEFIAKRYSESGKGLEAVKTLGFHPNKVGKVISVYKKQMLPSGKFEIAELSRNFLEDFLGEMEIEIYGRKITIPSTLAKDLPQEEARLHKIKSGIQGSTRKIFGQEVIPTIDDEVFFSTKNSAALEKLKKLFEHNYEENDEGLLITGLEPQKVREILTRTAQAERDQKRQNIPHQKDDDLKTPGAIVRNQTIDRVGRNNEGRE